MCVKSPILVSCKEYFIIGENSTIYWFHVSASDKFTVFTTNFDI